MTGPAGGWNCAISRHTNALPTQNTIFDTTRGRSVTAWKVQFTYVNPSTSTVTN